MSLKIALVAGEVSGDILGASLMRALRAYHPDVEFIGVGGPLMIAEGIQSIFPMDRLAVMGIIEVLGRLPELLWRRHKLEKQLIHQHPDVFIGIDAPDFNLHLESKLKKAGIKTVHYVSPSVWAWRQKRIFKIRKSCDLMLTLFPFEAHFYEQHDVPVCFVGHPLADTIPLNNDKANARLSLKVDSLNNSIIALLPGSRSSEITKLGNLFLDAASLVLEKMPNAHFLIPCATNERYSQIEAMLRNYNLPVTLILGRSHEVLEACDAVLIASGTATLEALLFKRPMVVAYKMSSLTYKILKKLVRVGSISLPNLLIGKPVVPEFIQDEATPENLAKQLLLLLENGTEQTEEFTVIHHSLRREASIRAAEAILNLVSVNKCS